MRNGFFGVLTSSHGDVCAASIMFVEGILFFLEVGEERSLIPEPGVFVIMRGDRVGFMKDLFFLLLRLGRKLFLSNHDHSVFI